MYYVSLTKSKIFLFCCVFFIIGIGIASFLPVEFLTYDLAWFSAVVASAIMIFFFWHRKIRLIVLIGLFLFLGIWRYSLSLAKDTPNKIWHYNGEKVKVGGVILKEPDVRDNYSKYVVSVNKICRNRALPCSYDRISGQILITADLYPEYNYGDELEIECKLKTPEKFNNFAYDKYLSRYDIYAVCYYPKIKLLRSGEGNKLYKNVLAFKNKADEIIKRGVPEPEAAITEAIILGNQRNIPKDLGEKFSQTGLSHIMAISGMNITIFAALLMSAFITLGLNRKISFYFITIFLFFYIVLIGAPASAVRAGVMGFLVLGALYLGRLNKMTNALALAATLMLLVNPKLLRDDIGFQLSFLALLGIIYLYPILEKGGEKFLKGKNIFAVINKTAYSALTITLAAQIFTLPILAYNFNRISLIAPIANLLILWTQPIFMVVAILGIILGVIFPSALPFIFFPVHLILKYIIIITENLAKVPRAYLETNSYLMSWFLWIIYYLVAVYFIMAAQRKLNFKK